MLTSVALVVCHVKVVDAPWLMVFGFADSDAVGAVGAGGGGGGGGAVFFAHAPRNISVPSAKSRPHILICRFTDLLQSFCAPELWRAIYRIAAGRTVGRPQSSLTLQNESTSNSSWAACCCP